jgi:hypothetical protein
MIASPESYGSLRDAVSPGSAILSRRGACLGYCRILKID